MVALLFAAESKAASSSQNNGTAPLATISVHSLSDLSPTQVKISHNRAKKATKYVFPIATRAKIVAWMERTAVSTGERHISSRAFRNFPPFFRGFSNANIARAMRLWKFHADYYDSDGTVMYRGRALSVTRNTASGLKRVYLKANADRGRKRLPWMSSLHEELRSEFDRLRKLGVKFNLVSLRSLALQIVANSTSDDYSANMIHPRSNRPTIEHINSRFVRSFADLFRIVSRAHKWKHRMSPQQELQIEKEVPIHLGVMKIRFESNLVNEKDVENMDETHFVINVGNGRTLGFTVEDEISYADVVSGGEIITMVVRVSGGVNALIEIPFMIFMNKDRNYLIRGAPDDIRGVSYRSGPKGCMDRRVSPK